jgi:hypothetical protein
VARREREILERAVRVVGEQSAAANAIVDEALDAGLDGSHPVTVYAKMLRLDLLNVKADLERELEDLVLSCRRSGLDVHWVAGLGVKPGHWGHREPAPHGELATQDPQAPVCSGCRARTSVTRVSPNVLREEGNEHEGRTVASPTQSQTPRG